MPEGQIVRALSSFYYVESEGEHWECKARGIFKKRKESPLVGDYVSFEIVNANQGLITSIKSRKNELNRPPVSNIDQVILVFSSTKPEFSSLLLDKFLVHSEKAGVTPMICITKTDLVKDQKEVLEEALNVYRKIGYRVLKTNKYGEGIEDLKEVLKGKISVFAGQSGVGKSTLLNTLIPDLELETGDISQKLARGKHTTRVVQFIHLPEGGKVADTPGFSQLDFQEINSRELQNFFREFKKYFGHCRFRGCLHDNEPGCAVKEAVSQQKIDHKRYEHYIEFLKEIKEKEEKKWR